jgi:MYXO-CTERM domain-containing protein
VLPDCGYAGDQLSGVVSHEIAEAITDTDVGPTTPLTANYGDGAWYLGPSYPCTGNQCPMNCGEVGDVCETAGDATIPGTSITSQNIWSNAQNGCDVSNPGIGAQNGPTPVSACTGGSGSGSSSSSGGSSGSGVDAGGGGGGAEDAGGGSSSSGGRGSSGGEGGGAGSGVDAGRPTVEAGGGSDDGGSSDMSSGGSASGCACAVTGERASSDAAALGLLLGFSLIGRLRRKNVR